MEGLSHGSVRLPRSKSESNRALMIAAYGGFLFETENGERGTENGTAKPSTERSELKRNGEALNEAERVKTENEFCSVFRIPFSVSEAHDTVLLQALLQKIFAADQVDAFPSARLHGSSDRSASSVGSDAVLVDCEDAGTVARFLLPFLAGREGTWLVTGTDRLCQRPMAPLVGALRQLGARIDCLGKEGFLPLHVQGRPLRGGALTLDGSQSSQFASALLLAAPLWEEGLSLHLVGTVASRPYLDMTLSMMRQAGAVVHEAPEGILTVLPKPYQACCFDIAADWSAASYWYEWVALNAPCSLRLEGLRMPSLQGDAVVAAWYSRFGVHTLFDEGGAVLRSEGGSQSNPAAPAAFGSVAPSAFPGPSLTFSFEDHPDLFPAVLVTCVALHRPAVFTGIRNLSLKESDRVKSLITELSKIYTFNNIIEEDKIVLQESSLLYQNEFECVVSLDTHHDHRVALALAPLQKRFPRVTLCHPEVVSKSYPSYWAENEALAD